MTINKQTLEVLKAGLDDSMNLMDEEAMDLIAGGQTCDGFCTGTFCAKNYSVPDPTPTPKPTCGCTPQCNCPDCRCDKA